MREGSEGEEGSHGRGVGLRASVARLRGQFDWSAYPPHPAPDEQRKGGEGRREAAGVWPEDGR